MNKVVELVRLFLYSSRYCDTAFDLLLSPGHQYVVPKVLCFMLYVCVCVCLSIQDVVSAIPAVCIYGFSPNFCQ